MNKDNGNIDDFVKQKNFPHVKFGIGGGIAIAIVYSVAGSLLTMGFPEEYIPYMTGLGQLLLMLGPTIIFSSVSALPANEIFRLGARIEGKEIYISIILLIIVRVLSGVFVDIQDMLIPESYQSSYDKLYEIVEEAYKQILATDTTYNFIRSIIIGAAIPALCEEALFRGFIQRSLEEKLPPKRAIVITSSIFAFVHLNPVEFVPLFALGYLFGYYARKTGSLKIPILLHFLNNVIAIIALRYEKEIEEVIGFLF